MALPLSSLLNPVEESRRPREPQAPRMAHLPSPTPSSFTREFSPPPKKQKMTKDGAVFTRGKTKGEIRYSPCDIRDNDLAREHRRFEMYPMGEIEQYPRHIPYNSDKKSFQEKTGRESFECFQYTFNVAKHEKPFLVLWDYNTGLVRMTPFFKCCNYSKTTPAKMLNMNPGLREVCHSITGGSLAAQGYWMPFEAAKAVATTFCYNIRHVLTPVFGADFIDSCIHPNDPNFGRMVIHKDIIQQCTDEAHFYRNLYSKQPFSRESSILQSPRTPETLRYTHPRWSSKSLHSKSVRIPGSPYGYGTDSDPEDRYYVSPGYRNEWTPANTPRSAAFFSSPPTRSMLKPIPTSFPISASSITTPHSTETMNSSSSSSSSSGSGSLTPTKRRLSDADQSYHDEDDDIEISDAASDADVEDANEGSHGLGLSVRRDRKKRHPADCAKDAKAAYMLMKLHMADASLREEGENVPVSASMGIVAGGSKRRAST